MVADNVALVIADRDRAAMGDAIRARGVEVVAVADPIEAMLALGRAPFAVIVVVIAKKSSAPVLHDLFRIARLRHKDIAIVTVGRDEWADDVAIHRFAAFASPALVADKVAALVAAAGDASAISNETTALDHAAPLLLEGPLSSGAGATLLLSAWGQELTGILRVDAGKAAGKLYFVAGDPVAAEDLRGDVVDVRERVRAVIDETAARYTFHADASFVEHRVIRRINPFGMLLESVRTRTSPASLLEALAQVEDRYVLPGVGLDRAAARLRPFLLGHDIATLATGSQTVRALFQMIGIDPLMGALVLLTLEEAHLVSLNAAPVARAPGSLRFGELSVPPRTSPGFESQDDGSSVDIAQIANSLGASSPSFQAPSSTIPDAHDVDVISAHETPPSESTESTRYELVEKIGTGGMAEVYVGRQLGPAGFAKKVAIKRILPEHAENKRFVEMFLEEARVAARLSHPNLVQIFELGRWAGDFYIVMEHVNGCDLSTLIALARRKLVDMPLEIAARVVADAAAGLHAAHSHVDDDGKPAPIIHRDVSPQNVLVSQDGHVKLTDFGIAKRTDSPVHTRAGVWKGKRSFLAPELLRGGRADVRSDVFATGIVLYMCLTGMNPYARATMAESVNAMLHDDPPPPPSTHRNVGPDLDAITMRAMARHPDDRYQSARDLSLALDAAAVAGARPALAPQVGEWVKKIIAQQPARDTSVVDPTLIALESLA